MILNPKRWRPNRKAAGESAVKSVFDNQSAVFPPRRGAFLAAFLLLLMLQCKDRCSMRSLIVSGRKLPVATNFSLDGRPGNLRHLTDS